MKDALKYFTLWRKKRSEMPVDADPDADWLHMQSLLDGQLPVSEKTGGFKGFRTLPALLITFSAAAMIYVAGSVYKLGKNHYPDKNKHYHSSKSKIGADSVTALKNDTNSGETTNINKDTTTEARKFNSLTATRTAVPGINTTKPVNKKLPDQSFTTSSQNRSGSQNGSGISTASPGSDKHDKNGGQGIKNQNSTVVGSASPRINYANRNNTNYRNHQNLTHGAFSKSDTDDDFSRDKDNADNLKVSSEDNKESILFIPSVNTPSLFIPKFSIIQPTTLAPIQNLLYRSASNSTSDNSSNKKQNSKTKSVKSPNAGASNLDWGVLLGVNTSGSFTPKSQNTNFYGSLPLDPYLGLYASYKINDNWSVSPEIKLFSPQMVNTHYTHANQSSVDSGQVLSITASRKVYAVSVPMYAVYNADNGVSFKAGPVFNFPVKQINATSSLLPAAIRTDSVYYKNISTLLNATQYKQNINLGFAAGVSVQVQRFIFGATYLKSLSGYGLSSGLGNYKSYNGTFQLTIGFQLSKKKP